ncbi:MAG: hypothetical protein HY554_14385 [Elusimicrobia bacterium]|nr:hypothetical protein [Elusimicrobiota bacterium]
MNRLLLPALFLYSGMFLLAGPSRADDFEHIKDQSNRPFGEGTRNGAAPAVVPGDQSALSQAASAAATASPMRPSRLEVRSPVPMRGAASLLSRVREKLRRLGQGQDGSLGVGAALAAVPGAASAQKALGGVSAGEAVMVAALLLIPIGLLWFVSHFNKTTLGQMIREHVEALSKLMETKRPELMKIPGVVDVQVVPTRLGEGDDSFAMAYAVITVDHLGPDNKALLPQPDMSHWNPGVPVPQCLFVSSVDGWPIVVKIR